MMETLLTEMDAVLLAKLRGVLLALVERNTLQTHALKPAEMESTSVGINAMTETCSMETDVTLNA